MRPSSSGVPCSVRGRPAFPTFRLLALAVAAALTAGCEPDEPPPAAVIRVERPDFDGARAYALVERQVEFGPRVPGTEGHAAQLEWMVDTLSALAPSVSVDTFSHEPSGGRSRIPLYNVLARFQPDEERRLLLLAHWDTRPRSDAAGTPEERDRPVPGANDGASGTAVLLELARLFSLQPPPLGVDLLFVDGEDYGPTTDDMFLGARRFASDLPEPLPVYGVLLDMVGDADPLFPIEGNSAKYAPQVAQRVWGVAERLGYGRYFPRRVGQSLGDDHVPLNEAGLRTIDVIDFEYGPGNALWHTPDDTPENVSATTLDMVGEVVAELVYQGG